MDTPTNQSAESSIQCPLFKKCGGCQLQNMTYDKQLEWKQKNVNILLDKFHSVEKIIGMASPYHYRNKVQAAFAMNRRREIISGVYQSSTHTIVPVKSCLIEDKKADKIICTIRDLIKSFKILPYDEYSGQGLLRHVLIKRGFKSNQIMVVLVMAKPIFPSRASFVKALLAAHPDITTIVMNINGGFTSLVLGETERVLYGTGVIEDTLCGCVFRISAKSFYQINPIQTEILYNKAIEFAQLTGEEVVIDAYCGIGTIGIIASKFAKQVVGMELNKDAVRDAIANARRNKIGNIYFHASDAGEMMKLMSEGGEKADVVFMDPPRAGSDEKFLTSLAQLAPKRIVYISCNPETQARDVLFLAKNGYSVEKIQPVDMFPHTNHVECVVLMSRVSK
ncbi:MAG: 23S rRNA (uracil(1939)-C(5))-methyltransferase RlmD [Oscillospiraceae bacterium]